MYFLKSEEWNFILKISNLIKFWRYHAYTQNFNRIGEKSSEHLK